MHVSSKLRLKFIVLSIYLLQTCHGFSMISMQQQRARTMQCLDSQSGYKLRSPKGSLLMHISNSHDHSHDHSHSHGTTSPNGLITSEKKPNNIQSNTRIIVSALLVIIPSLIRRRITKLDLGIFFMVTSCLALMDNAKSTAYDWISKIKSIRKLVVKHSTPMTKKYFFKNENAADKVTLLGVFVNIVLSISKFFGGIACNSAVLVADAGHSLSDLFSDFITLWAVQIARLPADEDHPYGHGKFESIGSLFLSFTLLATGLSVGSWSYDKLVTILNAQGFKLSTFMTSLFSPTSSKATAIIHESIVVPKWPALILAGISIASKEWLYAITRRVGEALNSQILIANAWHHRSDAFSSVLSLISIAFAIFLPQFVFADAAGGILVAGMICLSGVEILIESVKQLTDTTVQDITPSVKLISAEVEGCLGVKQVRSRSVGSGDIIDISIMTDSKLTASSAQSIAEKVRWRVMNAIPSSIEVTVRTSNLEPLCPLLSENQRTLSDIENDIKQQSAGLGISVNKVIVHYLNTLELSVEILIQGDPSITVQESRLLAEQFRDRVLGISDVIQAEVHLLLAEPVSKKAKLIPANS